jgi:hypothetical protein
MAEFIISSIGSKTGRGMNGSVYENINNSSQIIKETNWIPLSRKKQLENEIKFSVKAGELNVSPRIFTHNITVNEETQKCKLYLVMEKIDGHILSGSVEYLKYRDEIKTKYKILVEN